MFKIKVIIKKNNEQTHGSFFETQEEAEAWIHEGTLNNWWGKPEQIELDLEGVPTGNVIPAEYEVIVEDISAEIEAQKKIDLALQAQAKGNLILAKVWAINDAKNLSLEQMQIIFADPMLSGIERALRNGALSTAKALIIALDTDLFTSDEKLQILELF